MANLEMKATIDHTKIAGLTELLMAVDEFITRCHNGEIRSVATLAKFEAAMSKIGGWQGDLAEAVTITEIGKEPQQFYTLDGKAEAPSMNSAVAEALAAALKGLMFIHEGPALNVDKSTFDGMYRSYVELAIPKLKVLVENQIVPKYSIAQLSELQFAYEGKLTDKMVKAADYLAKHATLLFDQMSMIELVEPSALAAEVLEAFAVMTVHQQFIMNQFGFTRDDVELKTRQLLAAPETEEPLAHN